MSDVTLDNESAKIEFDRLCVSWHIELEGEDETGTVERIVRAIEKGVLVVAEQEDKRGIGGLKLILIHKLSQPIMADKMSELKYHFMTAGNMICMDEFKENQTFKRMIALVASLSGVGQPAIRDMVNKDLILGQCVGGLFLAV